MRACSTGLAVILLTLGALQPAQGAAPRARVVVVPVATKGNPNLKSQIATLVEKPLKKDAQIIPFTTYERAGHDRGLSAQVMSSPDAAKPAGVAAGASHVLLLEGVTEKEKVGKKKKVLYYVSVSLVEVATGETIFTKRYELKGKKLSAGVVTALLGDVVPKLQVPAPPTPIVEPPPPLPPEVGNGPRASQDPAGTGALDPNAPPAQDPNSTAEGAGAPVVAVPPVVETPPTSTLRARPGLRLAVGGIGFQRIGLINVTGTDTPPCYCVTAGGVNPVFGGGAFRAELYPLSFHGIGAASEGLGLHVDATLAQVKTAVEGSDGTTTSTVLDVAAGLTYRLVLGDSLLAPDLQFRVGYSLYNFPLKSSPFPGLTYRAPYGGLLVTLPLAEAFGFLLGGRVLAPIQAGGDAGQLGTPAAGIKNALGFHVEGGLRLTFAPLEITLLGFYKQYNVKFTGSTTFEESTSSLQFNDVGLSDKIYGGSLLVGLVF